MLSRPSPRRRGATLVESAIVYSLLLLLTIGLVIGAMGVFRYQEVASLAREGSRWASVRGARYQEETGAAAVTAKDVYDNAILPRAVSLDTANLSYSVTWNPDRQPPDSTVTVTVTYQWFPEAFLVGPINLTSTSTRSVAY